MTPIKQITLTLLAFLFVAVSLHAADRDAELRSAEKAYADGNYPAAAEQYEALIKNYGDAAEVYYNLGNAYYKLGRIAPAILNYERALVMNPGDGDTRFNLEMARQRTADRIEPADGFFGRAYRSVQPAQRRRLGGGRPDRLRRLRWLPRPLLLFQVDAPA